MEWIYLEQVIENLGFPTQFTSWIMECVKTVNYTILINGETTAPFDAKKGLRQGDPMSPFLFAIVMEYLSRSLHGLKGEKDFRYHPKCARLGITHLSFADDLLLFARGDLSSVKAMHRCFKQFAQASKLQENMGKSSVYFGGVPRDERAEILQLLGYGQGEMPFKYLGILMSTKKITMIQWHPLIQKIVARISSWTAKKLSYAGRVQLV